MALIGLKKIVELRPHVVTLDLEMPRMDGIEMLRQITGKHHVPVIVVSAQTERGASITLKALCAGCVRFCHQAARSRSGRIERSPRSWPQDQGRRILGRAQDDHHHASAETERSPARRPMPRNPSRVSPSASPPGVRTRCSTSFSQLPPRFSGLPCSGAAHAGRLYRNVRPPPG